MGKYTLFVSMREHAWDRNEKRRENLKLNSSFGDRVRRLRLDRLWSQQELSLRAGISTPHISSIERGKRFPSLEYAARIAAALGVSLSSLCDEENEFEVPKLHKSHEELPYHLQTFVLNEASTPYLNVAKKMSILPKEDSRFVALMVDLLAERYRDAPPSVTL